MNAPREAGVLEVRGLGKRFGRSVVLREVDLAIHPAEHLALVGNNGQGKTTLLRLMLGLLRPDTGEVRLDGTLLGYPRAVAAKRRIGYLPEAVTFYPNLSGRRTLRFLGRLKGLGGPALRSEADALLERVGLQAVAEQPVRTYSKGMRQRLGLAQALLGQPRLLLLDEPTSGLDPEGIHEFYDLIADLQQDGVAILMASHSLAEMEPRLDRLAVLGDGVVRRCGSIAELAEQARLPGTIRFTLREPAAAQPPDLARIIARAHANGSLGGYVLPVDNGEKYQVLQQLVRHAERMNALSVHEPGLEELFRHLNLGVAGPGRGVPLGEA